MRFTAATFKRRIEQALPHSAAGSEANGADSTAGGVVDLTPLLGIWDDEEFLREAYRQVLRRECDIPGFLHYREMLRNHVPRKTILRCLVNSEEGRQTGLEYTGVEGRGWGRGASAGGRGWVSGALQRLRGRALWLHRTLVLRPFELLEHKIDYLLHELGARSDQLSAKMDGYVSQLRADVEGAIERGLNLLERMEEAQRLGAQRGQTCADELRAGLDWLRQREAALEQQVREHQERQAEITLALAELRSALGAFSAELRAGLDGLGQRQTAVERQIQQHRELRAEMVLTLAELRNALSDFSAGTNSAVAELRQSLKSDLHRPVIRAGNNALVTESEGFILGVPAEEWRLVAHLAFRGPLEPGLLRLFRSLIQPGMVVVDVGAHIGTYTLEAARLLAGHGKVYSFEPTPRTFAILRDNVQVNGFLESGNVVLCQAAVADRKGLATLGVYPENSGHNTLFAGSDCPASVEVPTIALDEALAAETHVDVVKIDAEGAEPLILRGMGRILTDNPGIRILMEFAPVHLKRAGFDPGAFVEEIQSMGFSIARVHDVTGERLPVAKEELVQAHSANLWLARGEALPGGAA